MGGFPLAAIGEGLGILGGIGGLIFGNNQRAQAERAANQAITDLQASGEQQYSTALAGGERGLFGLTGQLNDALASTGRGLGASLAGAGVYNSSAVAGALANQGSANAQQLAGYQGNLAEYIANLRNQTANQVAQMRYGLATGDLNYARQQQAGSEQGLSSFLGSLGQLSFGQSGAAGNSPNVSGTAGPGTSGANPTSPLSTYGLPLGSMSFGNLPAGYRF